VFRPHFFFLIVFLAASPAACSKTSTQVTAPSSVKCQVTAASSPATFGSAGGSGSLTVTAERDCTWSASADAPWIAFSGSTTGQGTAVLPYKVAANGAPAPRQGTIAVGDTQVQVAQDPAPCRFALSANAAHAGADATTVSVTVDTVAGCSWNATSHVVWLTPKPANGSGPATIQIAVAANGGSSRAGDVAIGDQSLTVNQDAAPAPPPPPPPAPSPAPTPSPSPSPSPAPAPSPAPSPTVTLGGKISALAGSCPTISFEIQNTTVVAGPQTDFRKGNCKHIGNGDVLSVQGHAAGNGTILADVIVIGGN